jgi:hypothetical protein
VAQQARWIASGLEVGVGQLTAFEEFLEVMDDARDLRRCIFGSPAGTSTNESAVVDILAA